MTINSEGMRLANRDSEWLLACKANSISENKIKVHADQDYISDEFLVSFLSTILAF